MIQNKNAFQEFVPGVARPISRTPSESTQSELESKDHMTPREANHMIISAEGQVNSQYRPGLYMRSDPRHQPVRTSTRLIGYPLGYPRAAFGPKVS